MRRIKYQFDGILRAIDRLPPQERDIIRERYLQDDYTKDFEVYDRIGISKDTYFKRRDRAFKKLTLILNLEEL